MKQWLGSRWPTDRAGAKGRMLLADVTLTTVIALFSFFRSGYRFNGADNSFYLPRLYRAADSRLYPGDYFFSGNPAVQDTALDSWILPSVVRWIGIAGVPYLYFGLYWVCLWTWYFVLVRLFRQVRGGISPVSLAGLVLLTALADLSVGGVGMIALDRYFVARLEAKVAGLVAFYLASSGYYGWSLWAAGLAVLFHPALGIFMLGALLVFGLVRERQFRTPKTIFPHVLPLALCSVALIARQRWLSQGVGIGGAFFATIDTVFFQEREAHYLLSNWSGLNILDNVNRLGLFTGILLTLRAGLQRRLAQQSTVVRLTDLIVIYAGVGLSAFSLAQITRWRLLIILNPVRVFDFSAFLLATVYVGFVLVYERRAAMGQHRAGAWLFLGWPGALAALLTVGAFYPYLGWIGGLAFLVALLGAVALGIGCWLAGSRLTVEERRARSWTFLLFALGGQVLLIRNEIALSIALLFGWCIVAGLFWTWQGPPISWMSRLTGTRTGLAAVLVLAVAFPAVPLIAASKSFPKVSLLPEKFLTIQWPGTSGVGRNDVDGQNKMALYRWIRAHTSPAAVFAVQAGPNFVDIREYTLRPVYYGFKDGGLADPSFASIWFERGAKNAVVFEKLLAVDLEDTCKLAEQESVAYAVFRRDAPLGLETFRAGSYSLVSLHAICASG